jgi:hypothetical protein
VAEKLGLCRNEKNGRVTRSAPLMLFTKGTMEIRKAVITAAGRGQRMLPFGHGFAIPNLLRNGTIAEWLAERPQLQHLMLKAQFAVVLRLRGHQLKD